MNRYGGHGGRNSRISANTHGQPRAYRDYQVKNRPPPPTPATTDINDESESGYGLFGGQRNATHGYSLWGYDSEYYGGMASRPHPPTPRSQYDVSDYGLEEDTLVYPEEEIAFIPPPPSRCDTPPLEDDM